MKVRLFDQWGELAAVLDVDIPPDHIDYCGVRFVRGGVDDYTADAEQGTDGGA